MRWLISVYGVVLSAVIGVLFSDVATEMLLMTVDRAYRAFQVGSVDSFFQVR